MVGKELFLRLLEASEEDLEWEPGKFSVKGSPDRFKTIQEIAFAAYTNFPQGMEMLWLLTLNFDAAGRLAQAINWLFIVMLAILTVKLTRELGLPAPWPYAAALIFLAVPMGNRLAGYLGVDLPLAAYAALFSSTWAR